MIGHEVRVELLDMAHGKTGAVPPEVLVEHVMAVTAGGDWPVAREGMRAVRGAVRPRAFLWVD